MAEILTTKEIGVALERIIKTSERYICIFTYNIKIDETYLSRLRNAAKRGVEIIIVFGIDNGDSKVMESILSIPKVQVYFKQYLHAKFFYNEKELLIGSMNLSEASSKNNFEVGVLFANDEYKTAISNVKSEAKEIIDDAIRWNDIKRNTGVARSIKKGYCVRCALKVEHNPARPLCDACYSEWSDWENEYYEEDFCHTCGNQFDEISYAKPECAACYSSGKYPI